MDQLYSALAESVNLASNNLLKTLQHRENDITGWNRYCKNVHDVSKENGLNNIYLYTTALLYTIFSTATEINQ